MHRPRAGERGEVRRPLRPRLPPTPARDEPEHERAEDERHEAADHEHRSLAGLRARPHRPGTSTRSRPHPAIAAGRAPGVSSGRWTRTGAVQRCRPARASGLEAGLGVGGDHEHDEVLVGEQVVGGRRAGAGDRDDGGDVDGRDGARGEAEVVGCEREPGEPAACHRLEPASLETCRQP